MVLYLESVNMNPALANTISNLRLNEKKMNQVFEIEAKLLGWTITS